MSNSIVRGKGRPVNRTSGPGSSACTGALSRAGLDYPKRSATGLLTPRNQKPMFIGCKRPLIWATGNAGRGHRKPRNDAFPVAPSNRPLEKRHYRINLPGAGQPQAVSSWCFEPGDDSWSMEGGCDTQRDWLPACPADRRGRDNLGYCLRVEEAGEGRFGRSSPRAKDTTAAATATKVTKRKPAPTAATSVLAAFGSPRLSKVVKIAPVRPIPRTMPTLRESASTPAAIPWRLRGAAPISALLFGATNNPTPSPLIARPRMA